MKESFYAARRARTTFTDLSLVKPVLVALLIMEVVSQYRHLMAYLLLTFETAFHCYKFSDFSTRGNSFQFLSRQTLINTADSSMEMWNVKKKTVTQSKRATTQTFWKQFVLETKLLVFVFVVLCNMI
jgi:hypothetical protein